MRHRLFFTLTAALMISLAAKAQEPTGIHQAEPVDGQETPATSTGHIDPDASGTTSLHPDYILPQRLCDPMLSQAADSLHLPPLTHNGSMPPIGMYPLHWGGWYAWELHKGLNVNMGASVFAQFGKNARHGAGFTQHLSAMYAMPLTDKLSIAVGGYLNNMYWAHDAYRDAGASAVLAYRFDEHWEAFLYGQKSITGSPFIPCPLDDLGELRDRIGAAVKYNFSPNFSVQVSVERGER